MLHTLSVSPWHADIAAMLRLMEHGDDLVLLSDGVTAAIADGRFLEILQSAPITLYVLQDDVDARGLAGQIADSVGRVSYTDFVRLTVKHAGQPPRPTASWKTTSPSPNRCVNRSTGCWR